MILLYVNKIEKPPEIKIPISGGFFKEICKTVIKITYIDIQYTILYYTQYIRSGLYELVN